MKHEPGAHRRLLTSATLLVLLSTGCLASRDSTGGAKAEAPSHECTVTFFDRQDGEQLGSRNVRFAAAQVGDADPVEVCLDRATRTPPAGALAFECVCQSE